MMDDPSTNHYQALLDDIQQGDLAVRLPAGGGSELEAVAATLNSVLAQAESLVAAVGATSQAMGIDLVDRL